MVPVYPYHIRRSNAGDGGELLLSRQDRKSAMVLQLSMEQARMLAVELRGLATDHCAHHHLVLAVTRSLGAEVSGVLIKGVADKQVIGFVRLTCGSRIIEVSADVAAALAIALHLGLPIFMDNIAGLSAESLEPAAAPESRPTAAIPAAFREVIAALDLPAALEGEETDGRELNG